MLSVTKHRLVYTLVFGAILILYLTQSPLLFRFLDFRELLTSILGSELTYIAAIYSVHDNVYI